jgi:hypothetical protein
MLVYYRLVGPSSSGLRVGLPLFTAPFWHISPCKTVIGTKETLHLTDFIIHYEEGKGRFQFVTDGNFDELVTGWDPVLSKHEVITDLPQGQGWLG